MLNLAIVGLGKFGRRHVEAATASGRFRVVKAVVRNAGPVAQYAAARSIRLSADFAEVLDDPGVDAVSLVTPNSLHAGQVIQAAAAGKHVLAEKPFAMTAADAQAAVAACEKAGVVVAVGHDNRFYPAVREAKRLVDEGALGTVIHAEAHLCHDSMRTLGIAPSSSEPGNDAAALKTGGWRLERAQAPVGSMAHLGVHRIDSFVQLFGRVNRVYALPGKNTLDAHWDDTVSVLLGFSSGISGYVASSLATPLSSRMQILGSQGWVEASGPRDFQDYVKCSLNALTVRRADGTFATRTFEPIDSVMLNFRAFADAIEGAAPYPIPTAEMIHVPAVLEAMARSLVSGAPVDIA